MGYGSRLAVALATGVLFVAAAAAVARAETVALDSLSHIHGLTVDRAWPGRLYLATHEGLFSVLPDGTASRIGGLKNDLMAFAAHPTDPKVFYASGHPPTGGNLGFLASTDRGATWQQLAAGADGPVDFHAIAVSRAEPAVIYGAYQGLQVSRDGGRSWRKVGPLPPDTFDLAASASAADTVYAAARGGLFASRDGGRNWTKAYPGKQPVTLVETAADGRLYAFVYGVGLVVGAEPGSGWTTRSDRFAKRYMLRLAVDPRAPDRLYAVADTGALLTAEDGGRDWAAYQGHHRETPEVVAKGRALYQELCQACHGAAGVGERPDDMYAEDDYGFVAPPLDDSAHGWHHTDDNLVNTILTGSPRNPRMAGFKDQVSADDARDVVAYIKSLWSFSSLACQGARHMSCAH